MVDRGGKLECLIKLPAETLRSVHKFFILVEQSIKEHGKASNGLNLNLCYYSVRVPYMLNVQDKRFLTLTLCATIGLRETCLACIAEVGYN